MKWIRQEVLENDIMSVCARFMLFMYCCGLLMFYFFMHFESGRITHTQTLLVHMFKGSSPQTVCRPVRMGSDNNV